VATSSSVLTLYVLGNIPWFFSVSPSLIIRTLLTRDCMYPDRGGWRWSAETRNWKHEPVMALNPEKMELAVS